LWLWDSATVPSRREESKNKENHCGVQKWRRKIELLEEVIREILVADTDSASGAEASDVEDEFEEEEEEKPQQQQQQASAEHEPQVEKVKDCQPGDRLKEGLQIFILVGPAKV
jgi:hypothetical protein